MLRDSPLFCLARQQHRQALRAQRWRGSTLRGELSGCFSAEGTVWAVVVVGHPPARNHRARLRRWEQTDDVFQTAALRLHRSLSKVKPESVKEFLGLAATQIRRTLIDLARHHYGPEGQGANHESGTDRDHAGNADTPESLASWAEFHEQVDKLSDDEREVFQLLWYSGTTQREAAELLVA